MMTRREALKKSTLLTATFAAGIANWPARLHAQAAAGAPPAGPFKLPPWPYSFDALEPHIDARTMEIHHDKHHQAYITNLNKAVADQEDLARKTAEELVRDLAAVPEKVRTAVRNQAGGHFNHSLFWQMMKKGGGGEPKGALAAALDKKFKNFAGFKDEFTKAATGQFGSGWAWLTLDGKELKVEAAPNQDNPLTHGRTPLLGIDVWEHAYYLKYQNRRPEYIAAFFNVINWDFVAERYEKASA